MSKTSREAEWQTVEARNLAASQCAEEKVAVSALESAKVENLCQKTLLQGKKCSKESWKATS